MRSSSRVGDKVAILELVALAPVACFPKRHNKAIRELAKTGLIVWREDHWYPTAKGLAFAGYTLH
ncbi:MAG: hypothetical protein R3D44_07805 [Hyphomicrobiaceae bacterium]